jgi:hypothetical protein
VSRKSGNTFPVDIGFRLPETEKAATNLHVAPRQHRGEHLIRSDRGQLEILATAVEHLAAAVTQMTKNSRQNRNRSMTYAEAAAATGLSQDMLERMVSSGELKEGRHFIGVCQKSDKNGRKRFGRVLFHWNLLELMYEDHRLAAAAAVKKGEKSLTDQPEIEIKTSSKPRQNRSALNLDYGRKN